MSIVNAVCRQILALQTEQSEDCSRLEVFRQPKAPCITVLSYLDNIDYQLSFSESEWALCILYVQRLLEQNQELALTPLNTHKLVFTSAVLVHKYLHDVQMKNSILATVGAVHLHELNSMVACFLEAVQWNLSVPDCLPCLVLEESTEESEEVQSTTSDTSLPTTREFSELQCFFAG